MRRENVEITTAGIVTIEPDAPIALDATIHVMLNEGTKVLIAIGTFWKPVAAIGVAGHVGHVLEMAFAAFVADRTIMRVIGHKPFDHSLTETLGFPIIDRNTRA